MLFCCRSWDRLSRILLKRRQCARRKRQCLPQQSLDTFAYKKKITMFSHSVTKLHWLIYAMFLVTKIYGDSLTLNTLIKEMCSRTLAQNIFALCTGSVVISDYPKKNFSNVRGKRAAIFSARMRLKRQVADECCLHPCTVSQLIQYCPETWWNYLVMRRNDCFSDRLLISDF